MRSSILMSIILLPLSTLATPLPAHIVHPYQRRGVDPGLLGAPEEAASKNPAPSSSSSSPPSPVVSGQEVKSLPPPRPRPPFPGEPRQAPTGPRNWYHRLLNSHYINFIYFKVAFDKFDNSRARVLRGSRSAPQWGFPEFFDRMTAKNEEDWEERSQELAEKERMFQEEQTRKYDEFKEAQKSRSQGSPGTDDRSRMDEAVFKAARAEEQRRFAAEQKAQLSENAHRYWVVKKWVDLGRLSQQSPRPPPLGLDVGEAGTSAAPAPKRQRKNPPGRRL